MALKLLFSATGDIRTPRCNPSEHLADTCAFSAVLCSFLDLPCCVSEAAIQTRTVLTSLVLLSICNLASAPYLDMSQPFVLAGATQVLIFSSHLLNSQLLRHEFSFSRATARSPDRTTEIRFALYPTD